MKIPVIDIFAGPGGLGEGFSSLFDKKGNRIFDIKLSIEKDEIAHETLRLRSFFRQFPKDQVPEAYYKIIKQKTWVKRKALIQKLKSDFRKEWGVAENEAWCFELPYPEEFNKDGTKKGGYTPEEIIQRNEVIDARIKKALKGKKNFLLIGGPPCQAYSLVGRSRNQGTSNDDHRVHLYKEYLRVIAEHHPAVFVMENVKGLLSSVVDGEKIFDLIKRDLQDPSSVFTEKKSPKYKIFSLTTEANKFEKDHPTYENNTDYLIRTEEYGVPQKRHRVIFLGIREDISTTPDTLKKIEKPISLVEVIGDLPKIRSGINRSFERSETINGKKKRIYKKEVDSDKNWLNLINSYRKEIISWNGFAKDYSTVYITSTGKGIGSEFVPCNTPSLRNPLFEWYYDPRVDGAANHESRSHLVQDLKRYMFSSMYTKKYKRFPRLHEFEEHSIELLPDHENVKSGKFADRFRVQVPDHPATTVTSHISKDGHYFIHYDPNQCRSLTVREAARIQTFPDNYLFCGSRTAQYHQVGNAVPPYLAVQIAQVVFNVLA